MIWFNPLYNQNVPKNITKMFLKLIDSYFRRTHRLHRIFNCNTIKVSYICLSDLQQLIKKYNNSSKTRKIY